MPFSVLMSVYHKEKPAFLERSLESIIGQTLPPDEIVMVKDGPLTVDLEEIISEFCVQYPDKFKIIALPQNRGLGDALETGLLHCSYDTVIRMDSDDISVPERCAILMETAKNNPGVDVIGSFTGEFFEDPGTIDTVRRVPLEHSKIKRTAKYRNPLSHVTVALKKDSVLAAGNYARFLYHEDYYLWVRMLLRDCRMMNLPQVLVLVRTDENKYKRRGGRAYARQVIKFQKRIRELGFITRLDFIYNVVTRGMVALLPNKVRRMVYVKLLRRWCKI